jgi:CIC family chloride channel protein
MIQSLLSLRRSIYVLAMVVGAVSGFGAIAFEYLSAVVAKVALVDLVGYAPTGPRGEIKIFDHPAGYVPVLWLLPIVPAVGCFLSALFCLWWAPEAGGHGTDAAIDAYHRKEGRIRGRVPILKGLCSAITLGCGGSGGREGPIAQIGAGFGSFLGQKLKLGDSRTRALLAAGMAGGVGAIFRAPFAGALFAAEILYRDAELESEVVMPAFLSSAVAYCVFCGWLGEFGSLFELGPAFEFHRLIELVPYTVLALVLVPMIAFYTRFFYASERWFHRLPWPRPLVAMFGGFATGLIALGALWLTGDQLALSVASYGYGILQQTLDGSVVGWEGARLLLLVAVLKVVTTSCTIAAGGSGGVFGPSMVIGGSVGGAVGLLCHSMGLVQNPASLCVVGMCGFFAGAAKTPISTIVMVTEMTGSYQLLLPAMWVCGLTFLLSRRWALYQKQVQHRALSPAHQGEYQVALLEKMTVADVFEPSEVTTVPASLQLGEIVQMVVSSREDYFPVLDSDRRFVGVISVNDVRQFTFDKDAYGLAIASDIMSSPPVFVTPKDDLHKALETFDAVRLDELPVVSAEDPHRLLGRLRRRAINRAYTRRLKELKELQERAAGPR